MLLSVLDGNGAAQKVIVQAQEAVLDHSSTIAATGVSQAALAANANRSGCIIQNTGLNPMHVNDVGAATAIGGSSFLLAPGAYWPPAGYPVTTNAINIIGTISDSYACREW